MPNVSTLVALDEGVDPQLVRALVGATAGLEVAAVVEGLQDSWTILDERPHDIVVVGCLPDSELALWFVRESARRHPERPVVILAGPSVNGFVKHAFEAGADDLVVLPVAMGPELEAAAGQLRFAVEKAVARRSGAATSGATALAPLVCVLGPKGGIGKTLTSANLSVSLAMAGHRVALVDLDLQFGDVGLSLGLAPQRTVFDLVKSGGSMDADKVEAYLARHESGVRVLMAPVRPDQASAVTSGFLQEVYPLLRGTSDFVVVDTPPGFTPEVITSIDSSSDICMVGMLDSPSLKNTKLGLETLELMGYDSDRIRLLLNRADTDVGVTQEDVRTVLGRSPDILVPSTRDVVRSINEGRPVSLSRPRSEAGRAFHSLAALYVGAPATAQKSLRSRLRRKS
jgi:pilus assembly protein CpaE